MTVANQRRRAGPFRGDGKVRAFAFDFKVFDANEIQVVRTDAQAERVLTPDVDYRLIVNLDQNSDPGGQVIVPLVGLPLDESETLTLLAQLDYHQPVAFSQQTHCWPAVVEDAFDRTVMQTQQLAEQFERAILLPAEEQAVNTKLPAAWQRAGKALVFGPEGGVGVSQDDYVDQAKNAEHSARRAWISAQQAKADADQTQALVEAATQLATPGDGTVSTAKLAWGAVTADKLAWQAVVQHLGYVPARQDSPNLMGKPTAPTPERGDDSARMATTAFVTDFVTAGFLTPQQGDEAYWRLDQAPALLEQNGYLQLPNGLLLQWGYVPKPSLSTVDVLFPTVFLSQVFAIVASSAQDVTDFVTAAYKDLTCFRLTGYYAYNHTVYPTAAYWIALGR